MTITPWDVAWFLAGWFYLAWGLALAWGWAVQRGRGE